MPKDKIALPEGVNPDQRIELPMTHAEAVKWLNDVERAMSEGGSNDAEHDELYSMADEIAAALGVDFRGGSWYDDDEEEDG